MLMLAHLLHGSGLKGVSNGRRSPSPPHRTMMNPVWAWSLSRLGVAMRKEVTETRGWCMTMDKGCEEWRQIENKERQDYCERGIPGS